MQRPGLMNQADYAATNGSSAGLAESRGPHAPLPGQVLAPPTAARAWPTLPELVNALKRRLVLATFLGLLVGAGGAAAVWLAMPNGKHQAKAIIEITPPAALNKEQAQTSEDFEAFKAKQDKLIRNRAMLARVLRAPEVAKLPEVRNSDDPVTDLDENIRLSWTANLMEITIRGDDQASLKAVLEALLVEYMQDADNNETRSRTKAEAQLTNALGILNKEIEEREKLQESIVKNGNGPNPELNAILAKQIGEALSAYFKQGLDAKSELQRLESRAKDLDLRLGQLDTAPITADDLDRAVANAPQFQERAKKLADAQKRLEESERAFRPDSPAVSADREAARRARDELDRATAASRPGLEKTIRAGLKESLARDRAALDGAIRVVKESIAYYAGEEKRCREELNGINVVADKLIKIDDLKSKKDRRSELDYKLTDLKLSNPGGSRVTRKEEPYVKLNYGLKQKLLVSIAALLAGTGGVVLAVAFLEWRTRRVDSVDQVMGDLGLRVIGTIPAFPSKQSLKSGDAATNQNWRFVLNESVNSARTMLLHSARTQNMQVLMVTSAMQGEGKTSLASQLATSMATAGMRTLILDCDLRNPSMHKLFDAPLTPGCSEILCQEVDVSDAVQPTTVPNLWLIPAGQCSNRVISALAQGHPLESLFNRLRGQFDFVVVDSCPVLPVADSLLVGQYVDGVVISILQDISQLPKVQQVSEKLMDLNIPLLGAIVNGVKPDIHAYGYNYVKQLPA